MGSASHNKRKPGYNILGNETWWENAVPSASWEMSALSFKSTLKGTNAGHCTQMWAGDSAALNLVLWA